MPKKQYFTNARVARQAAENVQWITNKSLSCYEDNPLTTNVKYDRRNLSDLAGLLIDLSGVPENQKDAHFEAEMKQIFQAFDTPSKDDPTKSDPDRIRPYILRMFVSLVTDLNEVNYNDVNQVTRLLLTMRSVQMLATMVADFPEECSNLYPSKQEKGARLGFALISNHAFVDGNKRIGMYVLLTFLETNGIKLRPTNAEVARVGLAVAAGEMKYQELLEWILENET